MTRDAPVRATREIEVHASPEAAWRTLVDFVRWPEWNDDVAWVRLDGPVGVGSTFRWKSGPGAIRATVIRLEAPRHLEVTGTTLGIHAVHDWRIVPDRTGNTIVRTEESWSGLPAQLLKGRLQARLDRRLEERLRHLREEAERRATSADAGMLDDDR